MRIAHLYGIENIKEEGAGIPDITEEAIEDASEAEIIEKRADGIEPSEGEEITYEAYNAPPKGNAIRREVTYYPDHSVKSLHIYQWYPEIYEVAVNKGTGESAAEAYSWWELLYRRYTEQKSMVEERMVVGSLSVLRYRTFTQKGNIKQQRCYLGAKIDLYDPDFWDYVASGTGSAGWYAAEDKYWYREYYNEETSPYIENMPEPYRSEIMGHPYIVEMKSWEGSGGPQDDYEEGIYVWGVWDPPSEGSEIDFQECLLGGWNLYKIFGWRREPYSNTAKPVYIPVFQREDD
ncbi:MAG: hypothetical protein II966_08330 [Lachnospiraceae bacterium]|nr:hypothetical protein [Lachnospiraceae bacterium]